MQISDLTELKLSIEIYTKYDKIKLNCFIYKKVCKSFLKGEPYYFIMNYNNPENQKIINQEITIPKAIIFIGIQASGKSSFYKEFFKDSFIHINLDTLHTRNKENLLLKNCFEQNQSFVVDNTNPTIENRAVYIQAAKEHNYFIEGYFFQSILSDCIKRNEMRVGKACIPNKAIAATSNRLELPSYQEGFDKLYFVSIQSEQFMITPWNISFQEE